MAIVKTSTLIPTEKKKKSIIESISRTALIPSVVIGNAITGVIEKNIQKTIDPTYTAKRTTTKEAAATTTGKILGSGIALTGSALLVASGVAGKLVSTPKGKIAALVTGGAASVSPTVTKAVIESPAALVDLGIGIGKKVEELPTETTQDLGVGGLILAGAGGLLAGYGVNSGINAIKSIGNEGVDKAAGMLGTNDVMENAGVVTPQTTTMNKTASKKRKKTRSKAPPQQIRQSVRIDIDNKSSVYRTTKKYINNRIY